MYLQSDLQSEECVLGGYQNKVRATKEPLAPKRQPFLGATE